jgi:ABC-type nitrate/sulfonate/bicarbonate transport system permease component
VWGHSDATVILFLVLTVIWPIFFTILSSLKLARHDWQEAVTVYKLKDADYLRYYLWPLTVPGIITGSIIGLGEGWEALVATEMLVMPGKGLGQFFQAAADNPMITSFGILGLLILIFGINKFLWLPLLDWSHDLHSE